MHKLITIAAFAKSLEAEAMKLVLEQRGFEVFLSDDNLVQMDAFLSNAVGGVKLQVAEPFAAQARHIVELHYEREAQLRDEAGETDISFDCEACGRRVTFDGNRRGYVETCPHCDEFIDVPG